MYYRKRLLTLVLVCNVSYAAPPLDTMHEIIYENPHFDHRSTVLQERMAGEIVFQATGERCVTTGTYRIVVTSADVVSQSPTPPREGNADYSVGIVAIYPDGFRKTLISFTPTSGELQTSSTSFGTGFVLPPLSLVCFEGWDGGPDNANNYAIRGGSVVGHVPAEDKMGAGARRGSRTRSVIARGTP